MDTFPGVNITYDASCVYLLWTAHRICLVESYISNLKLLIYVHIPEMQIYTSSVSRCHH